MAEAQIINVSKSRDKSIEPKTIFSPHFKMRNGYQVDIFTEECELTVHILKLKVFNDENDFKLKLDFEDVINRHLFVGNQAFSARDLLSNQALEDDRSISEIVYDSVLVHGNCTELEFLELLNDQADQVTGAQIYIRVNNFRSKLDIDRQTAEQFLAITDFIEIE